MNSEVTLATSTSYPTPKGQVRLLFKRSDPHHAVLYDEDDVPRYYLDTSDAFSKVKIRDETQKTLIKVNRRMFLHDVFLLADRNNGKPVKVADVLEQAPTTSDGQLSMALHTEQGTYYWHKRRSQHWALYEQLSSSPVAWTETVSGTPATWELIVENQASNVLDYVLASLFYLKASPDCTGAGNGWESMDPRATYLLTK
ncbi:hypothetical protein D9756_008862 [Leucocoprinus leucothites]|uniref:Uncharacterized protein n=1 Tax=Leucocoprinus leucothites TaxID=201217 RepID=A0A8H5CX74_9AGAR|nr:hypothetical protein D9756_008862 [Leucoagaricus leucothites]